ncbi:MAG: hypothetical protein QF898_19480, partial [SAR202 cluster bacterium]|nr:hypothetical protein [SAR202 cluster bacterium]
MYIGNCYRGVCARSGVISIGGWDSQSFCDADIFAKACASGLNRNATTDAPESANAQRQGRSQRWLIRSTSFAGGACSEIF